MFRLTLPEGVFGVWFRYRIWEGVPFTLAYLKNLTTNEVITGWARCSARDDFRRPVGRKLALTRAAEHFPRPSRTALWREYLTQMPQDRFPRGGGRAKARFVGIPYA